MKSENKTALGSAQLEKLAQQRNHVSIVRKGKTLESVTVSENSKLVIYTAIPDDKQKATAGAAQATRRRVK